MGRHSQLLRQPAGERGAQAHLQELGQLVWVCRQQVACEADCGRCGLIPAEQEGLRLRVKPGSHIGGRRAAARRKQPPIRACDVSAYDSLTRMYIHLLHLCVTACPTDVLAP